MDFLDKTFKKRSKTGKWPSPSNFTYSKWPRYQTSAETENFEFLDKLTQKKCFQSKKEKKGKSLLNSTYSN